MKIPDSKKTNSFYRQVKKQNKKSFNANSVLGKGTIRKRMLGAFKKMGIFWGLMHWEVNLLPVSQTMTV